MYLLSPHQFNMYLPRQLEGVGFTVKKFSCLKTNSHKYLKCKVTLLNLHPPSCSAFPFQLNVCLTHPYSSQLRLSYSSIKFQLNSISPRT